MNKIYILTFTALLIHTQTLMAQPETYRWYFGMNAGLDFNSGVPVPVTDGAMNQVEGCSSIADSTGALLFYTDGVTVYTRQHTAMPNSGDLMGDISSTQSAQIVPHPGNASLYYIFTADADGGPDGFRYSMVDLTLNGGLGDVSVKNILLKNNPTEKITAVGNADGTGIWVMTHDWGTDAFYAYLVTAAGLDTTPVISNTGTVHSFSNFQHCYGQMKFSPNGQKLALGIGYQYMYELFDFDNSTGIVSHPITFNTGYTSYGLEFSADNTKMYTTRFDNLNDVYYLDQFDLSSGIDSVIIASQITLSNADGMRALQLGPDNKIYMAKAFSFYLGVINNPGLSGAACDFQDNSVLLDSSFGGLNQSALGLPGFIQSFFKTAPVAAFTADDTVICPGVCINFSNLSLNGATEFYWRFQGGTPDTSTQENPQNVCYPAPGNFPVILIAGNGSRYDTLVVSNYVHVLPLPPISLSVNGDTMQVFNGVSFQWYLNGNAISGATSSLYVADSFGIYTVAITDSNGCEATSTGITITGVESITGSGELKIFPVPATDYLNITTANIRSDDAKISIHNILGETIFETTPEWKNGAPRINVSTLNAGYYFLRYGTGSGSIIRRFIKE